MGFKMTKSADKPVVLAKVSQQDIPLQNPTSTGDSLLPLIVEHNLGVE